MSLWDSLGGRPDPEVVVREHGPRVYRHLKRIFGPRADVDDIYQMVFVEVLRSLPGFLGKARLSTWIRRITWNVAYQHMRQGYRAQLSSFEEESHGHDRPGPSGEGAAIQQQLLGRMYDALDSLDPKQRVAVLMHDVEGHTLKEIAHTVGRPLQTVASQLHSGRALLAEAMRGKTSAAGASRTKARGEADTDVRGDAEGGAS